MPSESEKEIARRIPEDVATGKNIDLLDELLTEDFVDHSPLGEAHGVQPMKEQIRMFHAAFPDFTARVDDIFAEDDMVAMRVTLSGTHDGPFMDMPPTGRSFEVQNTVFTRIQDGKIAERWVQPDMMGMLQQLGIRESPFERES